MNITKFHWKANQSAVSMCRIRSEKCVNKPPTCMQSEHFSSLFLFSHTYSSLNYLGSSLFSLLSLPLIIPIISLTRCHSPLEDIP